MRGWTVFYRMLGLPEDLTHPNYYELLGVDPKECNALKVEQAFEERKQLLRSNIPGGYFIPLVMKFEAEELGQAVSVLGDQQKRQIYDDYLKQESHKDLAVNVKKHRQLVIQAAKVLVRDSMNDDGTLDKEKRAKLAERLCYLGFTQNGTKVVLDGIPTALEKSEALAKQDVEDFVGVVFGLVEDEGYRDDDFEDEVEEGDDGGDNVVGRGGRMWKYALLWVMSLIIPFATILCFTIFLMYTDQKVSDRQERQETVNDEAVSVSKEIVDDVVEKPDEIPLSDIPVVSDPVWVVSNDIVAIKNRWSASSLRHDMLVDVAMALLACCDRVDRIAINHSVHGIELKRLLEMKRFSDRKYSLIRNVRLASSNSYSQSLAKVPALRVRVGMLLNESCVLLGKQLEHDDKSLRYQAIDTLRSYDTQKASAVLLNVLYKRKNIEPQMAGRIFRALSQMSDPSIPESLAILLQKPKRILIRPIVETLAKINGMEYLSPEMCPGLLAFSFTNKDVKRVSYWWEDYYSNGGRYRRGISRGRSAGSEGVAMGELELEVLNLIKVVDHYGEIMAETLGEYRRKDMASGWLDDSKDYISVGSDEVGSFGSMEKVVKQCLRLARTNPEGKKWSVRVDLIEVDWQRRLVLCRTDSQKAVVNLDATEGLLKVIIEQADLSGEYCKAVKEVVGQRDEMSRKEVVDVVEQMRLAVYNNLILWDILTRCMGR